MRLSIRARLTLWYTATLSLVLAVAATALYGFYARARLSQVDEELARGAALVARLLPPELDEGQPLAEAARSALEDIELSGRSLAVFDAQGALLAGRWQGLPAHRSARAATPAGPFRVHVARQAHGAVVFQVGVAELLSPLEQELLALRRALAASVALALLLAGGGGWWIARGALRPLSSMAEEARRISGRTPGARLGAFHPGDELGRLAQAFNELLARLEALLTRQRQFMADASHELRTPVSVARTAIDVTLAHAPRPQDEYIDALRVVGEQMRRLARVVEDMFTLARADAAGLPLERQPLYLDELLGACVREARLLAAPKGVRLDTGGAEDVEIHADERLLRRLFVNLLDNAVRHAPRGGGVRVDLVADGEWAEVGVANDGEAIPQAERERIFERFVRLDAARRPGDGAGLGLPIARAIAEAHAGTLALQRSDESGSRFLVRLPRRSSP